MNYRDNFSETIGPEITAEIFAIIKAKCTPMEAVEVLSNVLRQVVLLSNGPTSQVELSKVIVRAVAETLGGEVVEETFPPAEKPS